MNEKLSQCCIRLKEETKAAEKRLAQVGHALTSATEAGVEALEPRLKEAVAECKAQGEHAARAGQRIKQYLEATMNIRCRWPKQSAGYSTSSFPPPAARADRRVLAPNGKRITGSGSRFHVSGDR